MITFDVIGVNTELVFLFVLKKKVMPSAEVKYPPNMRMGRRNTEPSLPPDHRMMMPKKPTEYINAHSLDGLTNYPWSVEFSHLHSLILLYYCNIFYILLNFFC